MNEYIGFLDMDRCGNKVSSKRLSSNDFQTFIHSLFSDDNLKVKYQNPTAWRGKFF